MRSPLCKIDVLERGASGLQRLNNILHPDSRRHVKVAGVPCGIALPSEAAVNHSNVRLPQETERARILLVQSPLYTSSPSGTPGCISSQCMHCQGRDLRGRHCGEPPNARWKTLVTDFALADDSFCWISCTINHPSGLAHLRRVIFAGLMPVLC